jgi:16S rRNA U516 pseudouridylate synthase RsuA-like enzyme
MLAAVGAAVAGLRRVRVGPIQLGDLQPGALRAATDEELAALHAATAPGAKSTAVGDAAPG